MKFKPVLLSILLALIFLLGIGGCSHAPSLAPQPAVVMRVLDPSLEMYSTLWQREVGRRFTNAVVILVHGGDFVEGQWIVGDWQYRSGMHVRSVASVIAEAHAAFPGRTIVLLACNPGHIDLPKYADIDVPVYYAKSSIWCVPDRDTAEVAPSLTFKTLGGRSPTFDRWSDDPDVVGNIFEFIGAD